MAETETETHLQSSISTIEESKKSRAGSWGKWGILAAASVVVGGLAAAWWYKKAVKTLHQAEERAKYPEF
jgi:hypothetical protein